MPKGINNFHYERLAKVAQDMEKPGEIITTNRYEEAKQLFESGVPFEKALSIMVNKYWKDDAAAIENLVGDAYGIDMLGYGAI